VNVGINVTVFFSDSVTCERRKACHVSYWLLYTKSLIPSLLSYIYFFILLPFAKDFDRTICYIHGWAVQGTTLLTMSLLYGRVNLGYWHLVKIEGGPHIFACPLAGELFNARCVHIYETTIID
jgi:hypothetical protein